MTVVTDRCILDKITLTRVTDLFTLYTAVSWTLNEQHFRLVFLEKACPRTFHWPPTSKKLFFVTSFMHECIQQKLPNLRQKYHIIISTLLILFTVTYPIQTITSKLST